MKRRKRARAWPPKGSYPHPAGGYILEGPVVPGQGIRVSAHLKAEPDMKKLTHVVIMLAKQLAREERTARASPRRQQPTVRQ